MVIKKIGESSASRKVYIHTEYPGYVIKVSNNPASSRELYIQHTLATIGVAPKIYKCTPHVLMEEKCDVSLKKMLSTLSKKHKKQLKNIILK